MEAGQVAVIALAYLAAGTVKGMTGLGFSTTCLPILVFAVGLKDALPLVLVPSLASNILVMAEARHFRATVAAFWPLFLAQLPGIALGLWLLSAIDGRLAAAGLGIVLVAYAGFSLARPALALPDRIAVPLRAPVGLATGFVNGVTGSQVVPVVPYMLALALPAPRFVQAVNCSFTLSSLAMAVGLSSLGLMTPLAVLVSVLGILPSAIGAWAGTRARGRLTPAGFRTAVLVVLMALGAVLIVRLAV